MRGFKADKPEQAMTPEYAKTRYKCVECGKLTAGRLPVNPHNHRERGDGTARFPKKHKVNGKLCLGVFKEAEWI